MKEIRIFKNLNFSVVVEKEELHYNFEIYEITGNDSETNEPLYTPLEGYPQNDIEKSPLFISGHVKWDGCSNWNFDANKECMIHGCSREDIVNIGLILGECYDIAKNEMDGFDK